MNVQWVENYCKLDIGSKKISGLEVANNVESETNLKTIKFILIDDVSHFIFNCAKKCVFVCAF